MEVLTISITVVLLATIIARVVLNHRDYRAKERQGRSKPVGETIEEKEKDPTIDEYHTHTQNMERKTMTTKQNKTKFRKESMHASQPVQSMSVKGMGRVRWS